MVVGDVDENHPAIPMDPSGMHQVVMNLLSNALDAVTPNNGLIRAECHYDEANRQSVLEVIDNGAGIAPSMMKHMFELFPFHERQPRYGPRTRGCEEDRGGARRGVT